MECSFSGCELPAVVHVTQAEFRRCMGEHHFCDAHGEDYIRQYLEAETVADGTPKTIGGATCFGVLLVVVHRNAEYHEVYLREVNGTRQFLLVCGYYEATTISWSLRVSSSPRPLTHDAMVNLIGALQASVEYVLIRDRAEQGDFYLASLLLKQVDRVIEVDVRPSDAITLAIRSNVPIYIADRLLSLSTHSHPTESKNSSRSARSASTVENAITDLNNTATPLDEHDVFFVGHYAYRKTGSLRQILLWSAVGGALLFLAFLNDSFLSGVLLVLALVVLAVAFATAWAWIANRQDRLEISEQGITYGTEHWDWNAIAAIRVTLLDLRTGSRCIRVWIHKDRGPGRGLWVDEPITAEQHQSLVHRINQFCKQSRISTVCE